VEINDNTYSVQFLDSPAGRSLVSQRFTSTLPRPDRLTWHLLASLAVPLVDILMLFLVFIWAPVGLVAWIRAVRLRHREPLYRSIVRPYHIGLMFLGLTVWFALGAWMWLHILGNYQQ
jgi:hypothetical protein